MAERDSGRCAAPGSAWSVGTRREDVLGSATGRGTALTGNKSSRLSLSGGRVHDTCVVGCVACRYGTSRGARMKGRWWEGHPCSGEVLACQGSGWEARLPSGLGACCAARRGAATRRGCRPAAAALLMPPGGPPHPPLRHPPSPPGKTGTAGGWQGEAAPRGTSTGLVSHIGATSGELPTSPSCLCSALGR